MKLFKAVVLLALVWPTSATKRIRSPLNEQQQKQRQEQAKGNHVARALASEDTSLMNLQPHNPRHRELIGFFGSFSSFYCNGGFLAIIGAILALLGVGLVKPGIGCHSGGNSKGKGGSKYGGDCGGNSKSKGRTGRGLRAINNDLSFIQNKANYENMSDEELKDLVDRVLHSLEINVPDNHELHGRNLFLQLLGIVNCNPQPPNTPQNGPPVAKPDTASTLQGQPVTIPVLNNDEDPDKDPLTILSTTVPAKGGTVTINPDKTITYTPLPDFCNQDDTFEYTITDGKNDPVSALVTVTVACRTFIVTAVDDAKTTAVNTPVDIDVIANDTTDPVGGPLSVKAIVTNPKNGSVQQVGDKIIKYTPNPEYCGVDTFVYTAESTGGQDDATVTVTIECKTFVVKANDDVKSTLVNTPVNIDVIANDTTDPAGGPLSVKAIVTAPTNGSVKIISDKIVEYTPKTDYCGVDTFVYTAESTGGQDDALVTVTIKCVMANDDTATTPPATPVKIEVLKNDASIPAGQTLVITDIPSPPKFGNVVINEDNTITYTPTPGTGKCDPQDTFTYKIEGDDGATDTATVTVTIDCPALTKITAVDDSATTLKNKPVEIKVLDNDTTTPPNQPLIVGSIKTPPTNGSVKIIGNDKIVEYTPKNDYCGVDTFEYVAKSQDGAEDVALVTVTIKCVMAKPDTATTDPGKPVVIDVLKNDKSIPEGQKLTVTSFPTPPKYGTVTKNPDGTVTYTPNQQPPGKCEPKDTFVYEVVGEDGASDTATVTVTINCPVQPPPTCKIDPPLKLFYEDDSNFVGELKDGVTVCSNRRINVLVSAPQCTRVEFELKCKGLNGSEQVIEKIENAAPFYLFQNDGEGNPFWRDLNTYCGPGEYTLISKPKANSVYGPTVTINFTATECPRPPRD